MKKRLLLDMGGVMIRVGTTEGLPKSRLDWKGRQAMLAAIRDAGGRVELDDLERLLFQPWREAYERRYELGFEEAWEPHLDRLIRVAGVEIDRWQLVDSWFRPYSEQLTEEDGAHAALDELVDMGCRLAVVSNVPLPGRFYERVLERYDLLRFFDTLHFSYDFGSRKPSPALLRAALTALDARPQEALMVGDRRAADIAAGRAAGVETVWIESSFDDGPEADHTIGSLAELPALLTSLRG